MVTFYQNLTREHTYGGGRGLSILVSVGMLCYSPTPLPPPNNPYFVNLCVMNSKLCQSTASQPSYMYKHFLKEEEAEGDTPPC